MSKSNIPAEVKAAIARANSVEKSHGAHHIALVALMRAATFIATEDEQLAFVSLYTADRFERSKDSLCTLSTFRWLSIHFGVNVKDGVACRGRDWTAKGIKESTVIAGKAYPWYALAKDLAFKMPSGISFTAAATIAARLEVTGQALPSDEDILRDWKLAVATARKSDSLAKWAGEYKRKLAAGEIEAPKVDPVAEEVAA